MGKMMAGLNSEGSEQVENGDTGLIKRAAKAIGCIFVASYEDLD